MADLLSLVGLLPQLLSLIDYGAYVFWVLLFGSIAVRGAVGYPEFYIRWPLRLGFGVAGLVAASALAPLIRLGQVLEILQLNVLISGIVASALFAVGLYLATRGVNRQERIKKQIASLERRLNAGKERSTVVMVTGVVIIVMVLVASAALFRGLSSPAAELRGLVDNLPLPGAGMGQLSQYCTTVGQFLNCKIPLSPDAGNA